MSLSVKSLMALTTSDLMSRDLVVLPMHMPLRAASELLLRNQIGGAPVVDEAGRCIGVFSSVDFMRVAEKRGDAAQTSVPALPVTCGFQHRDQAADGKETVLCTLPEGICPIQRKLDDGQGTVRIVCSQPHCLLVDWQIFALEKLSTDEVHHYMTPDPVMVTAEVPIRVLALQMIDAHVHRIIVIDGDRRPIGIVSSTDLLAALAFTNVDA